MASALPAYTMNQFLLSKTLCLCLDSLMMRFWWGHRDDGHRHLYLKSWASICQPKAQGGLGLKLMWDLNRAQLTKLAWKIQTDPNSLWVKVIRAKYLHSNFVWEEKPKLVSSWFWRGITWVAPVLQWVLVFKLDVGLPPSFGWTRGFWIHSPTPCPSVGSHYP